MCHIDKSCMKSSNLNYVEDNIDTWKKLNGVKFWITGGWVAETSTREIEAMMVEKASNGVMLDLR